MSKMVDRYEIELTLVDEDQQELQSIFSLLGK